MRPINQYIAVLNSPKFYPGLVLLGANIILIVVLIFIGLKASEQYTYNQEIEAELATTKQSINLIRNNQSLLADRIDEYNQVLERLVPDDESYFSVISALDKLALTTGISITSYTINLESTTEEKLALVVNIEGDDAAIEEFLKNYQYAGGRLLTSENINISEGVESAYSFTLNFYHKAFDNSQAPDRKITQEELDFLNEISTKL